MKEDYNKKGVTNREEANARINEEFYSDDDYYENGTQENASDSKTKNEQLNDKFYEDGQQRRDINPSIYGNNNTPTINVTKNNS